VGRRCACLTVWSRIPRFPIFPVFFVDYPQHRSATRAAPSSTILLSAVLVSWYLVCRCSEIRQSSSEKGRPHLPRPPLQLHVHFVASEPSA